MKLQGGCSKPSFFIFHCKEIENPHGVEFKVPRSPQKWWLTFLQRFLFPCSCLEGNEVICGGLLQLFVFPGLSGTAENENSQKTTAIPTASIHFLSISGRNVPTEVFTHPLQLPSSLLYKLRFAKIFLQSSPSGQVQNSLNENKCSTLPWYFPPQLACLKIKTETEKGRYFLCC